MAKNLGQPLEYDKRYGQWQPDDRPVRESDGSNPGRYSQAPDVWDVPDNEPADVDWNTPSGHLGDPLETPRHPAYSLPTRWQGTTLEEMGF